MSEQPCKICGKEHVTGLCIENKIKFSRELTDRILASEDGEFLIQALQEAHASGEKVPDMFSEKILSRLSDDELMLVIDNVKAAVERKKLTEELEHKALKSIQDSPDFDPTKQTWADYLKGRAKPEDVVSKEEQKKHKVEEFLDYLTMLELYAAKPTSTIADTHTKFIKQEIQKLKKDDGIDMFQEIDHLEERIEDLEHRGAVNAIKAHLTHCRLQQQIGDMESLGEWYEGAKETVERNNAKLSEEELTQAQTALDEFAIVLKPFEHEVAKHAIYSKLKRCEIHHKVGNIENLAKAYFEAQQTVENNKDKLSKEELEQVQLALDHFATALEPFLKALKKHTPGKPN